MEKVKEAAPETKAAATPQVEQQPKLPEKRTGPQMVARSLSAAALPPPDGTPPAARAGDVLTSPASGFGAPQRARMSKAVQRSLGNTHLSQLSSMGTRVQTKLTVGAPNDPYEQEADRTADEVLRMPEQRKPNKEENKLQAKPLSSQTALMAKSETGQLQASPDLEQKINNSRGQGKTLPEDTRVSMESSLGVDFSNVNIHTGSDAVEMNQDLGAKAFTHGSDIYFNQGQYDPESSSGKHLLAHELTHTIQQGGSAVRAKKADGISASAGVPNIQAWLGIPGTEEYEFDLSVEGVKTAVDVGRDVVVGAAGAVKDRVVGAAEWIIDEIRELIDSGKEWLSQQWESIKEIASTGLDALQESFVKILDFIKSPLSFLAEAIMSFDAQSLSRSWERFLGIVSSVWEGFRKSTGKLLDQVNDIWDRISGFATTLLDRVAGLTRNFLFRRLPDAIQQVAHTLIEGVRRLWRIIDEGWRTLFSKIRGWIDWALDQIFQFVQRVTSFAISVVIQGIIQFGQLVLFLKDLFENPKKYIDILVEKSVKAFDGIESRFVGIVNQYFGNAKTTGPDTAATGTIQRQARTGADTEAKSSASWGDIGSGVLEMMEKKWEAFKADPWSVLFTLLLDMVLPVIGNVKDIIHLFQEIWKIVTGPLSADSLEDFWTSFLKILDIPILIYHTVVGILMRSLMLPLIVASFIPHPLVKAIAAAVGYALLGAFVQAELLNIGHKILLLKTGATNRAEKDEAYNRVADSLIALALAAVIALIMLILHFLANVVKGIYNFVRGKVFPAKKAPVGIGERPAEAKPVDETKPAESKPTEETKPVEETKPPEEAKPTEETKPAEPEKNKATKGVCFPAGTLVSTVAGMRPIETIRPGELVYGYHFDLKCNVERKVVFLTHGYTDTWIEIHIGPHTLRATRTHPIWVEALQSWLAAGDLTVGMQVRIRDGTVRTITQVQLLSLTDRQATYNLHVEEVNNFFAGNLELLVHNIDPARLAYLMRPGYSNYVLIDINGKIYYSGMFGPNESVASVQRRHSLNHDRFQPANGDRLQVIAEDQMYGEARLTEQRVAEANNTIKSNSDPNSYRQNRQNPLDPKKRVEYEEFVEKCG